MVDHLKAVGAAIKKSPKAIRKKIVGDRDGHDVLDEDWYHSEDPVKSGVSFFVKYMGSTEAFKTHGPGSTEEPVKKIVQSAKLRSNKLQKMKLTISTKSVLLVDADTKMKLDEIPLHRVSYCTVDAYYDKVFCYIARNGETKQLECHAYLCNKRSKAEAITLTVAQAFNIAYENWQQRKKTIETSSSNNVGGNTSSSTEPSSKASKGSPVYNGSLDTNNTHQEVEIGTVLVKPVKISPPHERAKTPTPAPLVPPQMSIEVTPSSPTRVAMDMNPFRSTGTPSPLPSPIFQRKNEVPTIGDMLGVQTSMSKAKSMDVIAVEDELDLEFQMLAEGRSNPNLLDIGGLDRSTISGEVKQYMLGDRSTEGLAHSKSHETLLL